MSEHLQRLRRIRDGYAAAHRELVAAIEALDDAQLAQAPPGAWNPVQIGWHVGKTTEFLSGGIAGAIAEMMVARPADFREQLATMEVPAKIQTFPMLEPTADMTRHAALAKLNESAATFEKALDTVTEARCATDCVKLPFGVFSLYEIGEFATAHVHRHIGQLRRTLAAT